MAVDMLNIDPSLTRMKADFSTPAAKRPAFSEALKTEAKDQKGQEQVKAALTEFSGQIWGILLNQMWDTVHTEESIMGGGQSEKIYRQMEMEEIGKHIASSGHDALTNTIIDQFAHSRQTIKASQPTIDIGA
jgi:Rod binding domain-containing protein